MVVPEIEIAVDEPLHEAVEVELGVDLQQGMLLPEEVLRHRGRARIAEHH
jgi:hypothetical protein